MSRLPLFIIAGFVFLIGSCEGRVQHRPDKKGQIGLQPIGVYDPQQLLFIQREASGFYNRKVVILPVIPMPASFLNLSKGERYSADSIIRFLSFRTNDALTQIVGLTHKDIYTTDKDKWGRIKEPRSKYEVWGIFGLGYCPGNAAVVSDFRLKSNDRSKFEHRIRNVVLHEIGHNVGLVHCPNAHCIMNDANEKIATVDNSSNELCERCRGKM